MSGRHGEVGESEKFQNFRISGSPILDYQLDPAIYLLSTRYTPSATRPVMCIPVLSGGLYGNAWAPTLPAKLGGWGAVHDCLNSRPPT